MREVADVFRRYGDAYVQTYGASLLPSHRRALHDIRHCRTEVFGGHVWDCDDCGRRQYSYHSCKNRHCRKCQGDETEVWLNERRRELLAVPYFHVVFTLPKELHALVRRQQRKLYGVLMQAAAQSLLKLAADPRYVGGRLGILAVLHTWTTTLTYHPHVHCLVPGGGVSQDGRWVAARRNYLVPVKALAVVFRGMFLEILGKMFPHERIPNSVWTTPWVIYCKPTVQGTEKVLQYLARYVHRVAFANSRLLSLEDGQVTFRYQQRRERQGKTMTLPASEFIRRFLQHVLPRGTHKVRYYGIWNPAHRALLRRVQLATGPLRIPTALEDEGTPPTAGAPQGPLEQRRKCPRCGQGTLILVETIPRLARAPP
jgi:hypothetical protein